MDKKDILKNVYDDFFGISKKKEEEELNMQIKESLEADTIEITMPEEKETINTHEQEKSITDSKDEFLKKSFEKIEKLYIDEKSKETMKKIIENTMKQLKKTLYLLICAFLLRVKKQNRKFCTF